MYFEKTRLFHTPLLPGLLIHTIQHWQQPLQTHQLLVKGTQFNFIYLFFGIIKLNLYGAIFYAILFFGMREPIQFSIYLKQESPPAWTQEAYRPPCSECSFCCPILADPPPGWTDPPGWLTLPLAGLTHPPQLDWPTPCPPAGLTHSSPPAGLTHPLPGWTDPRLDWPPPPAGLTPPLCTDRHTRVKT